jgi:hypothetical protein
MLDVINCVAVSRLAALIGAKQKPTARRYWRVAVGLVCYVELTKRVFYAKNLATLDNSFIYCLNNLADMGLIP